MVRKYITNRHVFDVTHLFGAHDLCFVRPNQMRIVVQFLVLRYGCATYIFRYGRTSDGYTVYSDVLTTAHVIDMLQVLFRVLFFDRWFRGCELP